MMLRKILLIINLLSIFPLSVAAQEATPENTATEDPVFEVEEVVKRDFVTSITFTVDDRMFWTEKLGVVGMMTADGTVQEEPVVEVEVKSDNEQGLLSMIFDPAFEENRFFYIFYTRPAGPTQLAPQNVIIRYRLNEENKGVDPLQLFAIDVPADKGDQHNGGRLRFGPDGFLYFSLGDMGSASSGQRLDTPLSKIHRVAIIGNQLLPAPGNPTPGQTVWATGVRNTFSFIFDPVSQGILATENGPSCDDEINLIYAGQNYGWSADVDCDDPLPMRQLDGRPPLISWTPTVAPTGIMLYEGDAFPAWKGQLFYCTYKIFGPYRVQLNENHTQFATPPVLVSLPKDKECMIELIQGPDDYIYYSHISAIYRLVPGE